MARIAIGGFQHETNTFAPSKASYEDFIEPRGWPGLTRGPHLFEAVAGINLPIAGFIEAARHAGHDLVPLLWCSTTPSAEVERTAYERIAAELCDRIRQAEPLDAIYLDLHGAMVAEHLEDGEGELLQRVRAIIGPALPIVCSLDLHANVTSEMVARATAMIAYRTYPHIDMAETGARCGRLLDRVLRDGPPPSKAFRKLSFLIPLTWQCTMIEPAASLYRMVDDLEHDEVLSVSLAMGFAPADIRDCGPAAIAYASSEAAAASAAERLASAATAREPAFVGKAYDPETAVRRAMRIAENARRPVILADTQDNPGAGANSDTVGLLTALAGLGARGAVLAILHDPEAAAAAHTAGEGASPTLSLGAKSGLADHRPFAASVRVERLASGEFTATGPFYRGSRMMLGPMALLKIANDESAVRVIVGSRKLQAADQAIFRHLGVEPADQKILALKSSVHFRADFEPIAEEIFIVAAPGSNPVEHRELPYRRLRPGVRLMPLGPEFRPASASAGRA